MKKAAQIYGNVAKQTPNPRELEANLLLDAASRLQAVKDSWSGYGQNLDTALRYNRRLWTYFLTAVTDDKNPLSVEIRENVANLGPFVCKQTMTILADPKPESLGSLISINRELAAGLLGRAA
jgi:flagellar biosynthesis activator protein FlaF